MTDIHKKRSFIFIFCTVLLNMIGLGVVMPVMPLLITSVTGEDASHAAKWGGYLTLAYATMQFIMMPVLGALSDRFGRRPVILGSMAAFSFDFLVMAIAPTMIIILLARFLAGAFAATFSTANAFIADITPPEKRAANFGMLGAAFGLGFVIGPAIGGFLGENFGARAPFYFVAAMGAVNFAFGFMVLPETLTPKNKRGFEWRRANAFGAFRQFASYPIMLPIAGVLLIAQIAHWTYPSVWAYFATEKFGWSPGLIAVSLSFVGLSAAVVQGGLTRLVVPKLGERRTALAAMVVTFTGYLAFAFVDSVFIVYLLIAYTALGGMAQPALQGIMSRTAPANAQGELQGAIAAVMSVSMIIGPAVMTQMFSAFTAPGEPFEAFGITLLPDGAPFYFPGAPFLFAAMLELLALALLFVAFARIPDARPATVAAASAVEA